MKKPFFSLIFVALSAVAASAHAAPDTDFALDAGTLGAGISATTPLASNVDFRSGFHFLNHNYDISSGGVAYNGKLKLGSAELFTDWHPFEGAFRLTGGFVLNNNKFELTGVPNAGSYSIDGVDYPASTVGQINAKVSFNAVAPYLGFGWNQGAPDQEGFHFTSDFGVMYQGSPKVSVTASGAAGNPSLAAGVQAAQDELRQSLRNYKFYPVVQVGIAYRF